MPYFGVTEPVYHPVLVIPSSPYCCFVFTSSTIRENRKFHVVSVQRWQMKCTKMRDARAKLLFCQSKPIYFLPFSLLSLSSLLKRDKLASKPGFELGLELGLEPGVRFSKVPLNFRARNQTFKSKYKQKERGSWLENYSILFH